jgi:hypothetical protein
MAVRAYNIHNYPLLYTFPNYSLISDEGVISRVKIKDPRALRAGRAGKRIPVEARFSAHVQAGPGAHPASCKMGTGSPSRR